MERAGFIVQVRLNSSRLPRKALQEAVGRPLLWHLFRRVRASGLCGDLPLTVATSSRDDEIARFCAEEGVPCFQGDELDVSRRMLDAAAAFGFERFIRLQGDDPLVCPFGLRLIAQAHGNDVEMTTTAHRRGWPLGMAAMALETAALEREYAATRARDPERLLQGFTPLDPKRLKTVLLNHPGSFSREGVYLTVDYPEDLEVVRAVLERLDPEREGYGFPVEAVVGLFRSEAVRPANAGLHEPFDELVSSCGT